MDRSKIRRKIKELKKKLKRTRSPSVSSESSSPKRSPSPPKRRRRIISECSSDAEPDYDTTNVTTDVETNKENAELFSLLGEDPTQNKEFSMDIHAHLAVRWTHILQKGLKKEQRSDLLKEYLPPANCTYLDSPKLNDEIKAAIQDSSLKRDEKLAVKQLQLGSGITCIGRALESVFKIQDKPLRDQIVKHLGDGGKVLCDLHYLESVTRRALAVQSLNKDTKEVVKNLNRDNLLFGGGLAESLRALKACSRSAADLKIKNTKPAQRGAYDNIAGPATSRMFNSSLNWRGPSRRPAYSAMTAGGYRYQERRMPTAAPARRAPPPRPPRPPQPPATKRY